MKTIKKRRVQKYLLKPTNCKLATDSAVEVCRITKDDFRCSLPSGHKGQHHAHGYLYDTKENAKVFFCFKKW